MILLIDAVTQLAELGPRDKEFELSAENFVPTDTERLKMELNNCRFISEVQTPLFRTLTDSSIIITNCTFERVHLCANCLFFKILMKNVTFSGFVLENGRNLEVQAKELCANLFSNELINCNVELMNGRIHAFTTNLLSEVGHYASSISIANLTIYTLAREIFNSHVEIFQGSLERCSDNIENSLVVMRGVTFIRGDIVGILDDAGILVVENSSILGIRVAEYVIGGSSVLLGQCFDIDDRRENAYFGTLSDNAEVHFVDFRAVNVEAPVLIADDVSGMRILTFEYCILQNIFANALISVEARGLHNVTIYQTEIHGIPPLFELADSFFIEIIECIIVNRRMNSALVCKFCENGALYIFEVKALLAGENESQCGSLLGSTFGMQLQLKMSRFEITGFHSGLSLDLIGHLLIESCYFNIREVEDGLVSELYADGIIFDCIIIVEAANAVLIGIKMTTVPVYIEDVEFFDVLVSGCTKRIPRSKLEILLEEYNYSENSDFPDWFRGFDYDYSGNEESKVYSDETVKWVFQFCYKPLNLSSSGKFIVVPDGNAHFLHFLGLDEQFNILE